MDRFPGVSQLYIAAGTCLLRPLCLAFVLLAGCGGSGSSGTATQAPADPTPAGDALSLLPAGQHVSFITGFNPAHPPATERAIAVRWQEAINAGLQVGRIQLDWSELEPAPGQYDEAVLRDALDEMGAKGLVPFVLLSTTDSGDLTLPADLLQAQEDTMATTGFLLDHPDVLARFGQLLDWVVPMIVDHGGWLLAVGNEPEFYIEDFPQTEASAVEFLSAAERHVQRIDSRLPVTMTLAQSSIAKGSVDLQPFLEAADVASFNFYAADEFGFFESHANTIQHEIDEMLALAGTKPVVFQELGAASGYRLETSPMNVPSGGQQAFFASVFDKMAREPRIRAAVIFQLVDWDPELVERLYSEPLRQSGLDDLFIAQFAEALNTSGLIRFSDGAVKPAWDTVLGQIRSLAQDD